MKSLITIGFLVLTFICACSSISQIYVQNNIDNNHIRTIKSPDSIEKFSKNIKDYKLFALKNNGMDFYTFRYDVFLFYDSSYFKTNPYQYPPQLDTAFYQRFIARNKKYTVITEYKRRSDTTYICYDRFFFLAKKNKIYLCDENISDFFYDMFKIKNNK